MESFLPRLTAYDPPDGEEGTLDPLGLALLANRIAELLVPGFTERLRRPRFLTALALGASVMSRREQYPDGVYGIERDGPAYLAWERLLVESFAQGGKSGDDGLLGVPGIQKARDAKASKARLSSQLYLKNPAAVGLWVSYKALAVEVRVVDKDGGLGDMGERLVEAWARGTGQANPLRSSRASWVSEVDDALTPLLGRGASRTNPNGVWERLHGCLHPSGMTQPEAGVIKGLLRDPDAQRERIFAFIEQSPVRSNEIGEPTEAQSLEDMANSGDGELAWRALLASKYEAFVGQLVTGFNSILFAASHAGAGSASAASTLGNADVGMTFRETPSRVRLALSELDAALQAAAEAADRDATVAKQMREVLQIHGNALLWLRNGALESPAALFDAVVQRHFDSQRRKPPDGKRRWIEGERDHYSVRLRFMGERPPPADGQLSVHGYRTRAARSCFYDLSEAH